MTRLQESMSCVITAWNAAIDALIDLEPSEAGKLDLQALMIPNY